MIVDRQAPRSNAFPVFVFAIAFMLLLLFSKQVLTDYVPVTQNHNVDHTVVAGSSNTATQIFAELQGRWPPNPNENDPLKKVLCYVLREGDKVLRFMVWAGTHESATGLLRGNYSWWQYGPSGAEAYGYSNKSLGTVQNVPTDLQGKGYTVDSVSCDSFTPPFQLLSP